MILMSCESTITNLVIVHEIEESAPCGIDLHQGFRHAHQMQVPARDYGAYGHVDIDVACAGRAASIDDGIAFARCVSAGLQCCWLTPTRQQSFSVRYFVFGG